MLKTFPLPALALLLCGALSAQTAERNVLANAGGTDSISGYIISWTLGETFVDTRYAHNCVVILTEGFQQSEAPANFQCPPEYVAVDGPAEGSRIHVFPNPTQSTLTIDLGQQPAAPLRATLTDAAGRTLRTLTLTEATTVLDLHELPAAWYFLAFSDGKNWAATVKVVKQ